MQMLLSDRHICHRLPGLPEHHVYLLTDTSHHAAVHLHEMLRSSFLIQ